MYEKVKQTFINTSKEHSYHRLIASYNMEFQTNHIKTTLSERERVFLSLIALLFPPAPPIIIFRKVTFHAIITAILMLFFWIPGVIYSLYIIQSCIRYYISLPIKQVVWIVCLIAEWNITSIVTTII